MLMRPLLASLALALLVAPAAAELPPERKGGDLTVHHPPKAAKDSWAKRLRTHTEGALSDGKARVWVGPPVPAFVDLAFGDVELSLLDRHEDGWVALYRQPFGRGEGCALGSKVNCKAVARGWNNNGDPRFEAELHTLMSRKKHQEVQDIRLAGHTLYFNEACQSYSKEAGRRCSAIVALDVSAGLPKKLWKSKNLVSNGQFVVIGRYIVAGYGFTSEKDYLRVLDTRDGKIEQELKLPKAPQAYEIDRGVTLTVTLHGGEKRQYQLQGFDGDTPKLVMAE